MARIDSGHRMSEQDRPGLNPTNSRSSRYPHREQAIELDYCVSLRGPVSLFPIGVSLSGAGPGRLKKRGSKWHCAMPSPGPSTLSDSSHSSSYHNDRPLAPAGQANQANRPERPPNLIVQPDHVNYTDLAGTRALHAVSGRARLRPSICPIDGGVRQESLTYATAEKQRPCRSGFLA